MVDSKVWARFAISSAFLRIKKKKKVIWKKEKKYGGEGGGGRAGKANFR